MNIVEWLGEVPRLFDIIDKELHVRRITDHCQQIYYSVGC